MRSVAVGEVTQPVRTWNPRGSRGVLTYIDLSAVDQDAKDITEARPIRCDEAPSRARQLVEEGDVLVSTVRPNLNGVARVPASLRGATASTGFTVLRPRPALDGAYLFHWVRSPGFVAQMVKKATGASYPAVSDAIVRSSAIPLPSLAAQRRIAAILDQADILCASARTTVDLLNEAEVALFQGTFACTPGRETWMTASLSEVVKPGTVVTYGIVQAGDECPGGVPYIRTGDIQDGVILKGQLRHTAPEIAARFARSKVEPGDIVMSIRATVGTTAVVPLSLEGANLTQGTARIATGGLVDGVFLLHYLRSAEAQRWIQSQVKGATFREITLERLRMLPVPIPPRGLQERFGRTVAMVEQVTSRQSSLVAGLRELFAALRDRAFKGEL